jgi:hypothetical protein
MDVLESYPLLVGQLGLARFVVRFEVKLVNVSITREDDWYVNVFDVLEAVILTICASLGSEHLEILFLTEKFVMGCGW